MAAAVGDLAFITSQNAGVVSVIDLDRASIVASLPLEGGPAPVAYDPASGRAWVIAAETGVLSALDEAAQITGSAALGAGAFGIAASGDGGLFVTDWYGGRLARLDADLRPVWVAETGAAPAGVALGPDGALVATADRDDDQVSIFDAATGQRLAQVKTAGAHPFAVVFHGGRLWTADVQGNSLSVIDPQAGRLVGQVATGSHPYGVAFAGGRGFVTNQYAASVTVFDPDTLRVTATIPVGDYPEGIATLPDDSGVVLAAWESDLVQIIDAASLTIRAEIEMPAGPRSSFASNRRGRISPWAPMYRPAPLPQGRFPDAPVPPGTGADSRYHTARPRREWSDAGADATRCPQARVRRGMVSRNGTPCSCRTSACAPSITCAPASVAGTGA
ncbi:MAG: YncE family protein [Paracoccus sp. (in: a-proteobacteria)]|uniref:YncE family protein n=1 Tax=Paracoccus sp. TaxID=267 RepID=UPI0026DFE7ED|nr:YncE family protein [Paracoccus sp. (in: a-proteobacteria)]MDO5612570.1 YncE family protein [Paracoccus sp. (in: a-proteobacteria)]